MKVNLIILIFTIAILHFNCNTIEPEQKQTLSLTVEDVSCIEAWLRITTDKTSNEIVIKQNDQEVKRFVPISSDTLIVIDSLLPNQSYSFQAFALVNNEVLSASEKLEAKTMDTTSHDFIWEKFTFGGEGGSSVLHDIAIIDDNNIWAVGKLYLKDSLGNPDPRIYNAVHWDGSQWEAKRISVEYKGNVITPILYSVAAFSSKEIWVSSGVPIKGDGINWAQYHLFDMGILGPNDSYLAKIWGSSPSELYFVGGKGTIVFYDGQSWQKINSGAVLGIQDIWGDYNEEKHEWEIMAVASNYGSSWDKEILSIKNSKVEKLPSNSYPTMEPLLSNWFVSGRTYYVTGSGIYQKKFLSDSSWKNNQLNITTFATTSIRGNDINDVVAVGAFGDLVHFNGVSWRNDYQEPLLNNGSYAKVAVKGNLVIAVGADQTSLNSEAVILIGRR